MFRPNLVIVGILGALSPVVEVSAATVSGTVRSADQRGLAGIFVTARDATRGVAYTVVTTTDGGFRFERLPEADYVLRAHQIGCAEAVIERTVDGDTDGIDFTVGTGTDPRMQAPAYVFLNVLPEGEEKRKLIVDCMGCHPMNQRVIFDGEGRVYDEGAWATSTAKMLQFAGHNTPFPILPPDRLAEPTARFLGEYLTEERVAQQLDALGELRASAHPYAVTEYDLPVEPGMPPDLPHDLTLAPDGKVLVTGMFSGKIHVLDPSTGQFTSKAIPTPMANPRALDLDDTGNWWIVCGMPKKIARYRVASDKWDFFDIGMYPHSIKIDSENRAWFNGHFTKNPILMGYVNGADGEVVTMEVPPANMTDEEGGPVPYGLRVGPDGVVWVTELAGNRLIKYDPGTKAMKAYEMPAAHSGPRRLDVDADGIVWVPEFSAGKLARFDPEAESFTEFDFPTPNSLPYCARVNRRTGDVWISQCGNDAVARFDPQRESFVEYRLPTTIAFIRHMDIDAATGEVWATYSHSPGVHPRIVRILAKE